MLINQTHVSDQDAGHQFLIYKHSNHEEWVCQILSRIGMSDGLQSARSAQIKTIGACCRSEELGPIQTEELGPIRQGSKHLMRAAPK